MKAILSQILLAILLLPPLVMAGTYQGLWIGQIELDQVNEVASKTDPHTLQPVKHVFDMTLLLHVDQSGVVRLLKNVTMMQKSEEVDGNNIVRRVLITDDSLLPEYEGIVRRDGKLVGIRLGSLAFDFPIHQTEMPLTGNLAPGNTLECTLEMDKNHPTNPFRHLYHPDHQQGKNITRQIQCIINNTQDNNDPDDDQFSLTGTYQESISGLHKIPIKMRGRFNIQRISEVGLLNQ